MGLEICSMETPFGFVLPAGYVRIARIAADYEARKAEVVLHVYASIEAALAGAQPIRGRVLTIGPSVPGAPATPAKVDVAGNVVVPEQPATGRVVGFNELLCDGDDPRRAIYCWVAEHPDFAGASSA